MEAHCNCGAIHVKVDDPELFSKRRGHICHCSNCRKTSGSALSTNLIIEAKKVTITGEDNLTMYTDKDTTSGNPVKRFFCKTCGSPIKSETANSAAKGNVILKLGIFDKIPQPEMETFAEHRQHWIPAHEGMVQYKITAQGEKMPGSI